MEERLVNLIFGSLLHDIGKIVHRSGVMKSHSDSGWEFLAGIDCFEKNKDLKECVRYHHGRDLANSAVADSSLAYITYLADNISAANDRGQDVPIEGEETAVLFERSLPLSSVFNILDNRKEKTLELPREKYTYEFQTIEKINYPSKAEKRCSPGDYSGILVKLKEQLKGIEIDETYLNSVLHLLESTTSYIPSSVNTAELSDISLYDHSKTTAAIASCIYYYVQDRSFTDLLKKEFWEEDAFILYAMEMSGIQDYIYTISGTEALKSLRARSLYLELLLENIVDELLFKLGLSRCNLIYTGGGHAYLLLPNTPQALKILADFEEELKGWFLDNYDLFLYVASGYGICNSNELAKNVGKVYERAGESIAMRKARRYKAEDIIKLNFKEKVLAERECQECQKTGEVGEEGRCATCQALVDISSDVIREDIFFAVLARKGQQDLKKTLPLPFGKILALRTMEQVRKEDYLRVYSKNMPSMGSQFVTNLWVGDYSVRSHTNFGIKSFQELAEEAKGIKRISVLRADVDDLGRAFIEGFKDFQGGPQEQDRYETISRTATLSRQLSLFFKYYINEILASKKRNAIIIYSGGDDLFIVGGWDEVIDLAKDIEEAFRRYTQGRLTISAGIGIYPHAYPISRIASEVGQLEEEAKIKDEHKKNKVTLFRGKKILEAHRVEDWVLSWDKLPRLELNPEQKLNGIEEKLRDIREIFAGGEKKGKALLYKILGLLRNSGARINMARYAYLLRRAEGIGSYKRLNVAKFYKYIMDAKDRKEMEIAITLYVYEIRE